MSHFVVDILTPNSIVAKDIPADELIIPAEGGEINVLPEHTHIISKLGTGVMTIKAGSVDRHFATTAGLIKVLNNKVTIMSYVCEENTIVDLDRAKLALQKAKEVLRTGLFDGEPLTDVDLVKYQRKLERAENRIKASYLGKGAH